MAERSQWQSMVETIALVAVAGAVVWSATGRFSGGATRPTSEPPRAAPLPIKPISLAGAEVLGEKSAKVGMVIYSDFQCPYCGKFARETLPALEKQYVDTGKVRLAFRQFPLPIHQFAEKAAEAAECAGREGKFWPFHDLLFAQQDSLDVASLQDRAKRVGLESSTFAKCLDGETAAIVQADKSGGEPLGVSATPTFLLGPILPDGTVHVSQRFSGALPLAQFQAALDRFVTLPTAAPVGGQD
jgi:protein-disulfide isomerase